MTLCLGQLKNSFGRLFLVFVMLLVGVFTGLTSASAADGEHFSWSDNSWGYDNPNFQGTITSGTDQVLFCFYRQSREDNAPYIRWNDDDLITYQTNDWNAGKIRFAYLVNPDVGTYSITNPSGGYISGVRCVVKENVSQTQPVNYSSSILYSSNSAYGYTLASSSTSILLNYLGYGYTENTFNNLNFFDGGNTTGQGTNGYLASWGTDEATSTFWVSPLSNTDKQFVITELNTLAPAPTHSPFDYLWSAFDISKEYQFSLDQNISLNVAYSITWEWDLNPEIDWYLTPVSSEETGRIQLGYSQLLTDDSAVVNYNQPIYDLIDYDFLDQEAEWVITVGEYNMSVEADELIWSENPFRIHLVGTNWGGQYIKVPDTSLPLIINPDTTSTSTIPFIYNLDNVASSTFENSQICLTSTQGGNTNPSEYCFDVVSSSGSNVLDLPMVFSNGTTNTWRFDLVSSSTVIFRGQEFSIEYFNGSVATSTDVATIFGDTAHNLACTTEEWEDANEGWLGVNTVISMCVIKESGWKFLDIVISGFQGMFKWLGNQLLSLFPLNIPTKILECWNNAQTAQLNADLTFLIAYETDKSIVGYMPKEWTGSASDTDLVIFSRQQMEQGSTVMATLFDNFKKFTVFFQWALFSLGLIAWSKQVYKDLSNNVHKDDDE